MLTRGTLFPFAVLAAVLSMHGEAGASGDIRCEESHDIGVEKVLACHIAAREGESTLDAIQNVRIGVEVTEPGFTVEADYRASREMVMRVDVFADGKRVFSEGIDQDGGWQQGGEGAEFQSISDEGFGALKRGIEFNLMGLKNVTSRGHKVSLVGNAVIEGVSYYVIKLSMRGGFERNFYINATNWMVERIRETSALHPDIDSRQLPSETIQGGYSRACGVLHPTWTRKIDLSTGKEIQRTRVTSLVCNAAPAFLQIKRSDL